MLDLGLIIGFVETDSSNAVQVINSLDDLSYQELIASGISKLLQCGVVALVLPIYSSQGNNAAHTLAESSISFTHAMY